MSPALPWVGDINCFFLCLDFLPVTEGYSYVVLGVDGDVINQGSECIKREFRREYEKISVNRISCDKIYA